MTTQNRPARLHTVTGTHSLILRSAGHFFSRFKGLMLSKSLDPDSGLLLTGCPSVHTAFMRYAIDVIYLDASGKVLKCVARLAPWRASISQAGSDAQGKKHRRAAHTLELAAGSIERLAIRAGDQLDHPHWAEPESGQLRAAPQPGRSARSAESVTARPRGSAMIEFIIVGPIITLIGLAILQYGMLFFAKNQMNHASFMAARAGSVANAKLSAVKTAYTRALVPIYGGGLDATELGASFVKAAADVALNTRIELLNPTQESFADWNDPKLQTILNTGSKKVIPNTHQGFKDQKIGATSGQTIADANLIKLRITHGYQPKVPIVAGIYAIYLKWLDTKTDTFHTRMVNAGRIPVMMHVTLQMQSDAIEESPVSTPGKGNEGTPGNQADPPVVSTPPPSCSTVACSGNKPPVTPGDPCTGNTCPPCGKT